MKVFILKSPNHKDIIGFGTNTVEFATKWLSTRSQYNNTVVVNDNKVEFLYDNNPQPYKIYGSDLRDGETCWINCDENLMGFNDNH